MGECGCGSTDLTVQFPGPDGIKYGLEIYPSCHYCRTPVGVVLHRFDPNTEDGQDMAMFFEGIPEADFQGYGTGLDWSWSETTIPVLYPEELVTALAEDDGDTPVDEGDVAFSLPRAVHESLVRWRQRRSDR